jgi:type III secretory pathway component EscS
MTYSIKILFSTLILAVTYGIIHDMVTAHLCIEYFTIGHPKIINSQSPVLLALTWGVIATWWVALPMGLLVAGFNQIGSNPSLQYKEVLKLIIKLLCIMFCIALFSGLIGYILAELNVIYLVPRLAEQMDESKYSKFLSAGWAHTSSYLSGIIGTFIVCAIIHKRRKGRI